MAAVDKIEEMRKPEDFVGHRSRGAKERCLWQIKRLSARVAVIPAQYLLLEVSMGFEGLLGNERLKENLRSSINRGRISHFYLISGPTGSGK